jgi:uncharacterized protein (TIGR02996 family)
MAYDEAFIQAIREHPYEDAPRLIYADWLEEHGQADRAEFIRIQCRLAQSPDTDPESSDLMLRAEELLRRHWKEWVDPLRNIVGLWYRRYGEEWIREEYHPEGLRRFQRGFVDGLALDAGDFLRHADALQRLTPLYSLILWRAGHCARELANAPYLKGVSVLSFADYFDAPLTASDTAALAASPYLDGLTILYLAGNSLGDEGVAALARASWLASVTYLDLADNGLSDRAGRALAGSPYLRNLQTLHLDRNYLSADGMAVLTNSPNLPHLKQLHCVPLAANALALGVRRP